MNLPPILSSIALLLGLATTASAEVQPAVRRMMLNDAPIMRVSVQPLPAPRFVWVEREAVKCISTRAIKGAMLSGASRVDFLLLARQRVRAHFSEECPALDFYGGFYLKPQDDRICAGRDAIQTPIGGSCQIEGFRHLVPAIKR